MLVGGMCEKEKADLSDWDRDEFVSKDVANLWQTSINSSRSKSGLSSSKDTNGMAATAHVDDLMAYQGVEGVLAFKNSDGRMDADTPGSRRN